MAAFFEGILDDPIGRKQRIAIILCAFVVLIMSAVALAISISILTGTPDSNTVITTPEPGTVGIFDTSGEIGKTEIVLDLSRSDLYDTDTYYPIIIGKNTRQGDSVRKYLPFRFEVSHSNGTHNHYLRVDAMAGGPAKNDYLNITTSRTQADIPSYYIYKNIKQSHVVLYVRSGASYFFILNRDLSFSFSAEMVLQDNPYKKYSKSAIEQGAPVKDNILEYFSADSGTIESLSNGVFSKT